MHCGAGAFEVSRRSIRLETAGVIIRDEPYSRAHDRIDLVAIFAIRRRFQRVAVDQLSACRIWLVEAEALGGSELGVLRMTVDVRAGDDLYLFGRGTDGILLLLEMSHILLNA